MISVIIPVYNSENFLEECLDSLLSQTFDEFEIVIVDDGSTDSSSKICDHFALSRRNVKVFHIENGGLLLARRKGMMEASGDYFMSLDSDDCLRSDAIEIIQKSINNHHADVICFNLNRATCKTYLGKKITPGLHKGGLYSGKDLDKVKLAVCAGLFNSMSIKAIKREVAGLEEDYSQYAGLMHGEDWLQSLQIMNKARSVDYVDEILYFYRENPVSSTSSFKESQINDLATVSTLLKQTASEWSNECMLVSEKAVCKHAQWLLCGIAKSASSKADKNKYVDAVMSLVKDYCGKKEAVVIQSLRYDFRIPLWLAFKKKNIAALRASMLIQTIYSAIQKWKMVVSL